jgi:hypothetical protein
MSFPFTSERGHDQGAITITATTIAATAGH